MRILIADDNEYVRRGVAALLGDLKGAEVCGEAANSRETIEKTCQLRPDLVLLDVSMPGTNGLETAKLLREQIPEVKVLILSQHDPHSLRDAALRAGAVGCLDKGRIGTDLLSAIEKIFQP